MHASTDGSNRPPDRRSHKGRGLLLVLLVVIACSIPEAALAHGVSKSDASFLTGNQGSAWLAFLYLGAKHMVTGYDHLLFLVGVIFFLYRLKDVAIYVSLFTVGHSITLLAGVLGGIHANAYIVDAIIGLSVVYKAFDNMGGFERFLGVQPNTKAAVAIFGLFHGFGLATKLQEINLSPEGLVTNMLSFNIGVEIGQLLALSAILIALTACRRHTSFLRHAFVTNTLLMIGGFLLIGYQLTGYFTQ
ncbi:MAG: HupE/UreJ family protein [Flavobacteriales bacterium]|nr:MAG: HupE/UreJ family protein [Flavobacteriales bacterium]